MFQSYYDIENKVVITSESDEATVNGYCQEFTPEEVAKLRAEIKEIEKERKWWRKLFKKLRRKK